MKKKTLITILFLIIVLACIFSFFNDNTYVQGASLYFDKGTTDNLIIGVSEDELKYQYDNIYSVTNLQKLNVSDKAYKFEATALAEIRGEEITFTNYYTGSTDYKTKNVTTNRGNTCLENNILAAIISGAGVENIGYKSSYEEGEYSSGAQLAIWEFWNTWVENSGANANGFEKGIGNGTITENGLNGETQRKKAQEFATQDTYNVNIYFLKYLTHNNEKLDGTIDNQPNLILIEILDEYENIIQVEVEQNSDISLTVSNNKDSVVGENEEISYNISVYNISEEEQQNLTLNNRLSEGVTLLKVVEIVDNNEVQLNENVDYNYNEETRKLTINISKIDAIETGTMLIEGESLEYTKRGIKEYKVTVKADELKQGIYFKEVKNVVEVQKENSLLARQECTNTISVPYLETEVIELPEQIGKECTIGLKITNKGSVTAKNVDVKISVPEEIEMSLYKITELSENGEEGRTFEGTASNEFEYSPIEVPAQKTVYIQLTGTINETVETKQITIEGNVNEEKITWTSQVKGGC